MTPEPTPRDRDRELAADAEEDARWLTGFADVADAIAPYIARARVEGARAMQEAAAKECDTKANRAWDDEGDYERGVDDGCVDCAQTIRAIDPAGVVKP